MAGTLAVPYIAAGIIILGLGAAELLPRSLLVVIGLGLALIIWVILGWWRPFNGRLAYADGPNPSSYEELRSRLNLLGSRLNCRASSPGDHTCGEPTASTSARCERDAACRALEAIGLQWLRGTGYVNVLARVHRAEEQFIEAQEKEQLIGDACEDLLKLRGSDVANRDELIRDLCLAATSLEPKAAPYFAGLTATPVSSVTTPNHGKLENGGARAILKTVRRALNDYRDTQRMGLLQVRNRILFTIMATEAATLLILGLAIVAGAGTPQILAATAYFVVGTGLGLLHNRLYTTLETQPIVDEDYGLGKARLLATPLFSGLAAVAGVLLVAVVPDVVNISGSSGTEGSGQAASEGETALSDIFVLAPINFVIAAIFGLSPGYLFDRLGQANKLLANLNSTKPTSRSSA